MTVAVPVDLPRRAGVVPLLAGRTLRAEFTNVSLRGLCDAGSAAVHKAWPKASMRFDDRI